MKLPTIKKNHEFRTIYSKGQSIADKNLVLYSRAKHSDSPRFGISVSSKVGGAVVRNRIKRQIKEILRINIDSISDEYDIIFVIRVKCRQADFSDIERSVLKLLKRASLIK